MINVTIPSLYGILHEQRKGIAGRSKDDKIFDLEDRLIDFMVKLKALSLALIKPPSKLELLLDENNRLISIFVKSIGNFSISRGGFTPPAESIRAG